MSEGGDEGIFAKLAEIAGGVKLIDHKLDASNRIQDERHERTVKDIMDLRERAHRNANGIQELFGWKHQTEGERKGFVTSGRLAWGAIGLSIGAAGTIIKLLLP